MMPIHVRRLRGVPPSKRAVLGGLLRAVRLFLVFLFLLFIWKALFVPGSTRYPMLITVGAAFMIFWLLWWP